MSDSTSTEPDPGNLPLPYGTGIFPINRDPGTEEPQGELPAPGGVIPSRRVEANTALIKLSRDAGEASPEFNNSGLMGLGSSSDSSSETRAPVEEMDEGEMSTEAASARIAQEYRRQVRIKRLAEEIQQAERDKKREEKRRGEGTTVHSEVKTKLETAKIPVVNTGAVQEVEVEQSKRRAEAMTAFKGAERGGRKSPARLLMVALTTVALGSFAAVALLLWYKADHEKKEVAKELAARTQQMQTLAQTLDPKVAVLESKLEQEKLAREAAEKKAAEEKRVREDEARKQEEQARILKEEKEQLVAEAKRAHEAAQKLDDENKRRDEELRKKAEETSRIVREKLKREQAEREAKVLEKSVAATPFGEVKTNPPQPAGIAGKSDLPTGAVRLFVKASDPYGGRLTFHWTQHKGAKVDIADPNFAVQKDGKWYSQTYFIAREPGSYEFEISIKNEDGVETTRKYPIEVLPVTTLK